MFACAGLGGVWLRAGVCWLAALGGVPSPPQITVRGDSRCPTASEVSSALTGMLPANPATASRDVVELSAQHSASVSVRLTNAQSQVIAEKRLPDALSCAERARAAAVIVAAWEARFAAPPPADAPPIAPPVFAAPPPPAPTVVEARLPDLVASSPVSAVEVEVGAAVLASLAAGALAPGLAVDVRVARGASRRGLGMTAVAVGTHDVAVGTARGIWRRYGGGVDLRAGGRARAVDLDVRAGALLTALAITGGALPLTSGGTVFDPGGVLGLRARWRAGALAPWLEATAVYWPRAHDLYVRGTFLSAQVPAFETWLCAGVSLGADR